MVLKKGEILHPGIDDEVALEQAKGTISNIIDALVELVTNCDDSYLSLENEGITPSGKIDIYIDRKKGGKLKQLKIIDEAAGMTPDKIEEIMCYGKRTSKIFIGINVRGLFGRGLKESILALGTGEIISISNGIKTHGKYYWDFDNKKLSWKTLDISKSKLPQGTTILIEPREAEDVECPTLDTISNKIKNHFALRDILSNGKRKVKLVMTHSGYRNKQQEEEKVKYTHTIGHQIENKKLYLSGFGTCVFKLYESMERLNYSRNDPCSQAGILIKSHNTTLDNQLFGFDNDPNAHYFYGEAYSPGIADKVKSMERGLIKEDRTGLNWRPKYCKELEVEIKKILSHHIERKQKQAEASRVKSAMPTHRKEKIKKLVRKLNVLGKQLIGDYDLGDDFGYKTGSEISHLTIYPAEASAPPKEERVYTIYNSVESFEHGDEVSVSLDESKGKFSLSTAKVKLKKHKKAKNLVVGNFKIKGFRTNDKTSIIVNHGDEEDIAEFVVRTPRKKTIGPDPPPREKGGLFKDINFDVIDKNPIQRVYYDRKGGIINIYIHYPGIFPFLIENGEGSESEKGSMLLSELIAKAFCKLTARRKVERDFTVPESLLDKYLSVYNEHLQLCIPIIHTIWIN
jgi:hypothetical protein